ERSRLAAPVGEVRIGRAAALDPGALHVAPQLDEPIGIAIRERADAHRIDQAEDCGVAADADREREDGDEREARRLAKRTQRIPDVLPHGCLLRVSIVRRLSLFVLEAVALRSGRCRCSFWSLSPFVLETVDDR